MKLETFDGACRELFHGWDEVRTFSHDGMDLFVQLRVSYRRFEAARIDRAAFISKLFDRARLEDLAQRIEQNARMRGLKRYGRKRR